jgi:hypothetical protein
MLFRRTWESNTWHWRAQCSQWPSEHIDERAGLPRGGHLCKECEALDLRSALQRLTEEEQAERNRYRRTTIQRVPNRRTGTAR